MENNHLATLESRPDRREVLRAALGIAAGTAGAALLTGLRPETAAAAGATFAVRIDATRLVYRYFVIPSVTGWISSQTIQSVNLAPGRYSFQIASGYFADFTFVVTAQGTIDYDSAFDSFLGGRGTSTLIITGFAVTLDARYLSGAGVLLGVPATADDWITYKQCNMVPASSYFVLQGSGEPCSFTFKLGLDGRWSYPSAFEVGSGGCLAGSSTSTLVFQGYPLLIDARAAGGVGVTVTPIWNMPFTLTSVEYANLLPAAGTFALLVRSGIVSAARFSLTPDGRYIIDPSSTSLLQLDNYKGLRRLTVLAPI